MHSIVMLSGKARVGKDTVADYIIKKIANQDKLSENYFPVYKIAFADEIKRLAERVFGWDGYKDEKGRNLLIDIGEAGRKYDINVWVKHVKDSIKFKIINPFPSTFIISDWRFDNEYTYLKDNLQDFKFIKIKISGHQRLEKNDFVYNNSHTENALTSFKDFDIMIDNSFKMTLKDLYKQIDKKIIGKVL